MSACNNAVCLCPQGLVGVSPFGGYVLYPYPSFHAPPFLPHYLPGKPCVDFPSRLPPSTPPKLSFPLNYPEFPACLRPCCQADVPPHGPGTTPGAPPGTTPGTTPGGEFIKTDFRSP